MAAGNHLQRMSHVVLPLFFVYMINIDFLYFAFFAIGHQKLKGQFGVQTIIASDNPKLRLGNLHLLFHRFVRCIVRQFLMLLLLGAKIQER